MTLARLPVIPPALEGPVALEPEQIPGVGKAELFSSFRSLRPEDLLVIELCAGTVILSTTAARKGFRVMAVDNNPRRALQSAYCA